MPQYFFGGVNASGKSTLIGKIKQARPEFKVIHTRVAIMERLGIAQDDIETFRLLPEEYKYRENESMFSDLTKDLVGKSVIYDSHYLNMIEGKITPLISGSWLTNISSLILVEADPKTLLKRIMKDRPVKNRRLFPDGTTPKQAVNILGNYSQQNREECERIASMFNLPVLVLRNDSHELDKVVQKFLEFIKYIR